MNKWSTKDGDVYFGGCRKSAEWIVMRVQDAEREGERLRTWQQTPEGPNCSGLEQLNRIDEVLEGYIIMGSFDIIIKVEVPETKDLRPLVTTKIRSLLGIRQSFYSLNRWN